MNKELYDLLLQRKGLLASSHERPRGDGPVWATDGGKHVYLLSELNFAATSKLLLPLPRKGGILMITTDSPLGGWDLRGFQHPFAQYGYELEVVDVSMEKDFPSKLLPSDFLGRWDGVCVVGDDVAELSAHLKRTGLLQQIRRTVGERFFYIGVHAGSILAAKDLTSIVPAGTKEIGLVAMNVLPYANFPEVARALEGLKAYYEPLGRQFVGITNEQVAQFTGDELKIL